MVSRWLMQRMTKRRKLVPVKREELAVTVKGRAPVEAARPDFNPSA